MDKRIGRKDYSVDYMKNLGSIGGAKSAIIKRTDALIRYYANPKFCKNCNEIIEPKNEVPVCWTNDRSYCSEECKYDGKIRVGFNTSLTKGFILNTYRCLSNKLGHNKIRENSRKVFCQSELAKQCVICGYDRHIEVAHIKPVSDFDSSSLLSEINSLNNLVALCPNHHWEFDNGMIDIKTIEEMVGLRYQDQ